MILRWIIAIGTLLLIWLIRKYRYLLLWYWKRMVERDKACKMLLSTDVFMGGDITTDSQGRKYMICSSATHIKQTSVWEYKVIMMGG